MFGLIVSKKTNFIIPETFLIEDPDPNGPFGAKEVGQGPLLPVMPAVVNAIYDAVGVRIDDKEDVYPALKQFFGKRNEL